MLRRICAVLLACVLCLGVLPRPVHAEELLESYADLDRGAWYAPGVRYCLKYDLMTGYGKRIRLFSPNMAMTRAQLVTVLWRMAGEPKTGLAMQCIDVADDIWYVDAVRWALAEDIMTGSSAILFDPDAPITREQFTMTLWRFTRYLDGAVPLLKDPAYESYADCDAVSVYARDAMQWACAMGIVTGYYSRKYNETRLKPEEKCSRAVVATMLMRYCLDYALFD